MESEVQTAIRANIAGVRERVRTAAARAGRDPKEIRIIAVTKTYGVDHIVEAVGNDISLIGENKVQEAKEKLLEIEAAPDAPKFELHLIGHLQTNKVRQAVEIFDLIQSVDSFRLAQEIDRRAYTKDRVMPILIQVNTSREPSKYGINPDDALGIVKQIAELKNLKIQGLMTIGALTAVTANDSVKIRSYFRKLREIRDFVREQKLDNVEMDVLSMGMSSDFEIAVEEGATHLRIGTALFGKRKRAVKTPKPEEKP